MYMYIYVYISQYKSTKLKPWTQTFFSDEVTKSQICIKFTCTNKTLGKGIFWKGRIAYVQKQSTFNMLGTISVWITKV